MTQILFAHVHVLLAAIGTFAVITHSLQSKIARIWVGMNSEPVMWFYGAAAAEASLGE